MSLRARQLKATIHTGATCRYAKHTVSAFLAVWDGLALIDAGAGFANNDDLAAALLGIRPSRHVPADDDNPGDQEPI